MVDGLIEPTHYLRNPLDVLAQQIVAHVAIGRGVLGRRSRRARAALRQLRRALRRPARQRARPARRPLPERGVLRAAAAARVGPRQRHGCAPATVRSGSRSRAAARSPIAGCSACSSPTAPGSASSTRRWCTRAAPARRSCSARRRGASRTSRSSGSPSPRRRASRARCRSGTATVPAARSSSAGPSGRSCARSASSIRAAAYERLHDALLARCVRRDQPRPVPRRAGRGHRRRARRPHGRRRALPRRDRRLAGVHPQPVRHAGARAVGDGDRAPVDGSVRPAGRDDVGRRRHRHPAARGRRRAAARRAADRPRRHRRARRVDAAPDRAVLRPLPRVRRASAAVAAPPARSAHAAVAAAPACGRPAGGGRRSTRRSRSCSRRRASVSRTCSTCPPSARCSASCGRGRSASSRSTPPRPARWRRACCSTGSPRTCTRATPRSPNGGPRRWRSTATCCATCSAPRSCASCSIGTCSPTSSSSCSASPTVAGRGRPTSCTTCSARSATSPRPRSICAAKATAGGVARRAARRDGGRSSSPSAARPGTRRPRTPPATATRSGARSRSGCRWRSPSRSPGRSRSSSAGSPARTGRSSSTTWHAGSAPPPSGSRARSPRSPPTSASCTASSVPTACSASGATSTCCASCDDDRWRRCAARSSRSSRPRSPASSRRGTASPPIGAGTRRSSRRSGCCPARALVASTLETDVLARARARLPAADARRAVHDGRGGVGRRRRDRFAGRPDPAVLRRPAAAARSRLGSRSIRPTVRCTTRSAGTARRARRQLLGAAARGGARGIVHRRRAARRAVGSRVGGRGHQRLAGPAAGRARRGGAEARRSAACEVATGSWPATARSAGPHRATGRRRADGASSRRCCEPAPTPTEAAHAQALQLIERYGVVTREAVLAEGVAGGFASVYGVLKVLEERGQVRRGYFVDGLGAAQFALPGRGRSAAGRPRHARPDDPSGRRAGAARARRHRSGPAVRRRARVARDAGPAGAHRHVRRGAPGRRRRWCGSIAAPPSRHVPRHRGRRRWADALVALVKDGRAAASRSARSTVSSLADRAVRRARPPARRRLRRRLPRPDVPRLIRSPGRGREV